MKNKTKQILEKIIRVEILKWSEILQLTKELGLRVVEGEGSAKKINLPSGEVCTVHFHGKGDLKHGVIRTIKDSFKKEGII